MHIQLAEKHRNSVGHSSESGVPDPNGDSGLQNVISYLRRSKEIVCIIRRWLYPLIVSICSLSNFRNLNRQKQRSLY